MNQTDQDILTAYTILEENGDRGSATVSVDEFAAAAGVPLAEAQQRLGSLAWHRYLRPHLDLFKPTSEGYEARDSIEHEEDLS